MANRAIAGAATLSLCLVCLWASLARADKPASVSPQTLKLPSGPTSLKGLGESFEVSPSTGAGSFSVPLMLPPAALAPGLSLSYAAGSGRSELGVSFQLPLLSIYRQTAKGTPKFDERDRFSVRSESLNDELVLVDEVRRLYRLKNEGAFALFERDVSGDRWQVRLPSGRVLEVGGAPQARETSLGRTHRWYVTRESDRFGHAVTYDYFKENDLSGRVYLSRISYQLHASEAYQNHVELAYESRPDIAMDASSGEAIVTSQRVRAIVVKQGARVLRTYHLGYRADSMLSTLSEVELEGENGERMPVLSFEYIERSASSGQFVQMQKLPPIEGLVTGTATLEDVTGDGLPDLLVGQSGSYGYYENVDGVNWARVRTELRGDPDRSLGDVDVVLADVDGDGARDVVYSHGSGFRYAPAGRTFYGTFEGYGAVRTLGTLETGFTFGSPHVKLVDLNGDGRTDLLSQRPGQDVQLLNEQGERIVASSMPELPGDVQLSDARVELLDFNGDGVLDFVRKEIGYSTSRVRVWYGLGGGRYMPEQQMLGVPKADGTEFTLQDVNRDGQSDLVRVSGTWAAYYLNDGHGMFLPKQGSYKGLPATSDTQKLLFADMNGNGTTDLVWLTRKGQLYYLDLVGEPFAGLLSRIDNGLGLVTELAYRSSADFAVEAKRAGHPWKASLPHPMPVIAEQRVSDSLDQLGLEANVMVTTFAYGDGYWDGKEREFRGFARVTTTEWGDALHETLVTEQHFHVGRDFDTGMDEEGLKGKPTFVARYDELGQLYTTSETIWERRSMCRSSGESGMPLPVCDPSEALTEANKDSRISLALSPRVLHGSWETTSSPRFSAEEREYDGFGNATVVKKWGEVALSQAYEPGQGFALGNVTVGDDEAVEETDYLYNTGEWLLGFPAATRLKARTGEVLTNTRTFYDDPFADRAGRDPADPAHLTQGLATVVQTWLAAEQRWMTDARRSYDAHGLCAWQEEGGRRTSFEREPLGHYFVSAEAVAAGTADAPVPLRYVAEYDLGHGVMTRLTSPSGQHSSLQYDGLGRVERVLDSRDQVSIVYDYVYGSPLSTVSTHTLVDAASGRYARSVEYVDGAGRLRLKKQQAEEPYGFVASGFARWSARGVATGSFRAFASASDGFEPAPRSAEVSQVRLDALGRVSAEWTATSPEISAAYGVATPLTLSRETHYEPFVEKTFSERDLLEGLRNHPTVMRSDGLGRVRTVERSTLVSTGTQRLVWQLDYDARGLLTALADTAYVRSYAYDGASRLRAVVDPSLGGEVTYGFDDGGRLLRREDALGQTQRWTYDLAGRPLSHVLESSEGEVQSAYGFRWDTADTRFFGLAGEAATHLLGRLAAMEYPTGTTHYSYDAEGRPTVELSELWNPEAEGSSFAQQVRDAFVRRVSYNDAGLPTRTLEGDRPGTSEQEGLELSFGYNARLLPTDVHAKMGGHESQVFSAIRYRAEGDPTGTDLGNGLRTCAAYDARGARERFVVDLRQQVDCGAISYSGGRGVVNLGYRHGADGLLTAVDDLSVQLGNVPRFGAQFEYDRIGRLISAEYEESTLGTERFAYDEAQNLIRRDLSIGGLPESVTRYIYGDAGAPDAHRLARVEEDGTSTALTYDALGQTESYGGFALGYDAEGRLVVAAGADGTSIEHHFDGTGVRRITIVRKPDGDIVVERTPSESLSVRDGEEIVSMEAGLATAEIRKARGIRVDAYLLDELTAYVASGGHSSALKKPLPAEYMDLDGDQSTDFDAADLALAQAAYWSEQQVGGQRTLVRYVHGDQIGSATHLTDSQGDIVSYQRFFAYGRRAGQAGLAPHGGFTGQPVDLADLGIVHMGAREYAPRLGRWLTPDRFIGESPVESARTLLETNLYAYAKGNPVRYVDPQGTQAEELRPAMSSAAAAYQSVRKIPPENRDATLQARAAKSFNDYLYKSIWLEQFTLSNYRDGCMPSTKSMVLKYSGVLAPGLTNKQIFNGVTEAIGENGEAWYKWRWQFYNADTKSKLTEQRYKRFDEASLQKVAGIPGIGGGNTTALEWRALSRSELDTYLDNGGMAAVYTNRYGGHWLVIVKNPFDGKVMAMDPYDKHRPAEVNMKTGKLKGQDTKIDLTPSGSRANFFGLVESK